MYRFAGFFVRPAISRPPNLPARSVWRDISVPFEGSGLLLPDLFGESPALDDVDGLAKQFRLHSADAWLYLAYDCWGGGIDFVYGLSMRGGVFYGPVEESDWDAVEATYIGLMVQWGVTAGDALSFGPFVRGFWGEV